MNLIVADASAVLDYLLRTSRAGAVASTIEDPLADIHLPFLCDVEVVAVVRRGLLAGQLTVERGAQAVQAYLDLPVNRHPHTSLLPRMLELRANLTAHDAAYVALAERLGAALLTTDERLKRSVERLGSVRVL